jgi:hypothetical protein
MFYSNNKLGKILSFKYSCITCLDKKEDKKYWLFIYPIREESEYIITGDCIQNRFEFLDEAIQCLNNIETTVKKSKYEFKRDLSYDKNRPFIIYYWVPESWI